MVYRLRNTAGDYRWAIDAATPRFDAAGNFAGLVGVVLDIHEQQVAERALQQLTHQLQATNQQLVRTNLDLDNFVYTASHDLRQPIDNMAGIFQELARSARYDDPDAPALVTMFEHSLEQIYTTIKELAALVQVQKQSMLAAPEQVRLELDFAARHLPK